MFSLSEKTKLAGRQNKILSQYLNKIMALKWALKEDRNKTTKYSVGQISIWHLSGEQKVSKWFNLCLD